MRRWLIVAVLVVVGLGVVGCDAENAARRTKEGAGAAAPWVPEPFNMIAIAVATIAAATEAVLASRRKRAAATAEEKLAAEASARNAALDGIHALSTLIDKMATSEDPKIKELTEKWLAELKKAKKSALAGHLADGLAIFDAIRKSPQWANLVNATKARTDIGVTG